MSADMDLLDVCIRQVIFEGPELLMDASERREWAMRKIECMSNCELIRLIGNAQDRIKQDQESEL